MTTWVLGVNMPPFSRHDAAACLVDGAGRVVALGEEERFSRVKHATGQLPRNAVDFCLAEAGLGPADIDLVALGWDAPRIHAREGTGWRFGRQDELLAGIFGDRAPSRAPDIAFVPHHLAHAASAFHASGYPEAAVLVADGAGEDESITIFRARQGEPIVALRRWSRLESLGFLFDAASMVLGLGRHGAGQTMGLAAYGRAAGLEPWPMFHIGPDGPHPLMADPPAESAPYQRFLRGWFQHFNTVAGGPVRPPDRHRLNTDPGSVRLAWSVQAALEEVMAFLAAQARELTGLDALCIAGGVGLNCSANGRIPDPLYVPPVAHDAGAALGAAWSVLPPREPDTPLSAYLGAAPDRDWRAHLAGATTSAFDPDSVVKLLLDGKIGAVVQGRAEIGPRALCHRSIIALPDTVAARDRVNAVKHREPWRPLSPVGLSAADGALWRRRDHLTRYMLGAVEVTDAQQIPAVVHVDGTARPQVLAEPGSVVGALLASLAERGCPPVLLNTSFNGHGEPIVNSAADAYAAFRALGLDFLIVEDVLLTA